MLLPVPFYFQKDKTLAPAQAPLGSVAASSGCRSLVVLVVVVVQLVAARGCSWLR
jgi:hypothetical protein